MNEIAKREKSFFEKWISLFLFCMLLFHFAFTLHYNITEREKLSELERRYYEPLFKQNFKIYAPNVPDESTQLIIKYQTKKAGWSGWINPGVQLYQQIQRNRFSTAHNSFLLYKLAIHDLNYGSLAAQFYAQKNTIPVKDFTDFQTNYLSTSVDFKHTKDYLLKEIKSISGDTEVIKIKCALLTAKFAAPQSHSYNTAVSSPKIEFFEFDFPL